jgi:hypothetical protein
MQVQSITGLVRYIPRVNHTNYQALDHLITPRALSDHQMVPLTYLGAR